MAAVHQCLHGRHSLLLFLPGRPSLLYSNKYSKPLASHQFTTMSSLNIFLHHLKGFYGKYAPFYINELYVVETAHRNMPLLRIHIQ